MFCMMKVKIIYFCCPEDLRTKYPSGKKVSSAISLAISIEPTNVIMTIVITARRMSPVSATIRRAIIVKKLISLRAHITASVQKRQVSVLKSK